MAVHDNSESAFTIRRNGGSRSSGIPSYDSIFDKNQHLKGKARTYTIESMNNRLRCYLARLRRKTHCYSKSAANLRDSLLFIFQRRLKCALTPQTRTIICPRLWEDDVSIPI